MIAGELGFNPPPRAVEAYDLLNGLPLEQAAAWARIINLRFGERLGEDRHLRMGNGR